MFMTWLVWAIEGSSNSFWLLVFLDQTFSSWILKSLMPICLSCCNFLEFSKTYPAFYSWMVLKQNTNNQKYWKSEKFLSEQIHLEWFKQVREIRKTPKKKNRFIAACFKSRHEGKPETLYSIYTFAFDIWTWLLDVWTMEIMTSWDLLWLLKQTTQ